MPTGPSSVCTVFGDEPLRTLSFGLLAAERDQIENLIVESEASGFSQGFSIFKRT